MLRRCEPGGARGQAEQEGELVFLQVLGFKELEALLDCQAFLQTLHMGGVGKQKERRNVRRDSEGERQHLMEMADKCRGKRGGRRSSPSGN